MATRYNYQRTGKDDLIGVFSTYCSTETTRNVVMALDTGASHTVFDLNELYWSGFRLKDALNKVEIRTGKGVVVAYQFCLPFFEALGLRRENFVVTAYDFYAESGFVDICNGMIGLDFLEDADMRVNFRDKWITLEL